MKLLSTLVALGCSAAVAGTTNLYAPRLDIGGYYFTDSPHGAGALTAYLPVYQQYNEVLYVDGRAIQKTNGKSREFNLALAYRKLKRDANIMLGTYLFYDNKRTSNSKTFQQATLGVESWFNNTFFGGNFYFPFGKRAQAISSGVSGSGDSGTLIPIGGGLYNILITEGISVQQEVAMIGGDASLGYQFTRAFAAYGGVYYYHSSTKHISMPSILGPMLRIRYIVDKSLLPNDKFFGIFDRTSVESQVQWDSTRKWRWYLGLQFSLLCGTPTRKLTIAERHMTDQPIRDIDVVSAPRTTSTSVSTIAKDSAGKPIQVFIPAAGQSIESQVGNPDVQLIAVNGIHADYDSTKALANGQGITGGDYTVTVNGRQFTVHIAENGILRSKSGENLLRLSSNNTVSNITLEMVNPLNTATGNRAIFSDGTVNDLGTITIDGVTSNGALYIERDGAAQKGTVNVTGSSFSTPSTWTPTGLPAVGEFETRNSSTLSITVSNSTFETKHTGTTQIVGLRFDCKSSSVMTVNNVTNNKIIGSDSGLIFSLDASANMLSVPGDISGNTINAGTPSLPSETALLIFAFQGNPVFEMTGALKNNTLTSTSTSMLVANFTGSGANPVFNFLGGITNNNMTTTVGTTAFNATTGTTVTTTIQGMYGNTLSSAGSRITVTGSGTTLNVGSGSQGLSAANNGASVAQVNSPTINPGP